jgi:hypothetical protein
MAVLRMDPKQFALYQHKLAQRFTPILLRGVQAGAQRVVALMIERTTSAPPANPAGIGGGGAVNTGDFRRRWRARPLPDGAVVTNDHPASPTIEHGRRPGKRPPRDPIAQWARRRLGLSETEAMSVAFLVARAIGRRGLIGRKIMTAPEAQTRIEWLIRNEIIHEINLELKRRP